MFQSIANKHLSVKSFIIPLNRIQGVRDNIPCPGGENGGQGKMRRKQFTPEKVIGLLRQAEVELAQGKRVGEVCRSLGISEQSYYRWRSEYGGLKLEQARRMKDLEKENGRLKKAVAELTLDKQILKEALEGNF